MTFGIFLPFSLRLAVRHQRRGRDEGIAGNQRGCREGRSQYLDAKNGMANEASRVREEGQAAVADSFHPFRTQIEFHGLTRTTVNISKSDIG